MKKCNIAINTNSVFAKTIAPMEEIRKKLTNMGYFNRATLSEINLEHVNICYVDTDEIKRSTGYIESYGFFGVLEDRSYFMDWTFETFISRIIALEDILGIFNEQKSSREQIVDHDGSYFEDGEYYVYHECKRCHKKIFIKVNSNGGYEYPHRWARHYGPEIEGNLCPSCEEKLSEMKKDLCIRFLEGEKL